MGLYNKMKNDSLSYSSETLAIQFENFPSFGDFAGQHK